MRTDRLGLVDTHRAVTRPRPIHPGETLLARRSCAPGRRLLRPGTSSRAIFEYCLGRAIAACPVEVHEFVVRSDSYSIVMTDVGGCRPAFFRTLNQMLARAFNRGFDERGALFAPGSYDVTILDPDDVVGEVVCLLAASDEAASGTSASSLSLHYGVQSIIRRPRGCFPDPHIERVALALVRPSELEPPLDDTAARCALRDVIWTLHGRLVPRAVVPAGCGRPQAAPGSRLVAMAGAFRRRERRRQRRRSLALRRFVRAHHRARRAYRRGRRDVLFPRGTYQMAVRFGVRTVGAQSG